MTKRRLRFRVISPAGLIVLAAAISIGYGLCHALGLRSDIALLTGTTHLPTFGQCVAPLLYVCLYLAFVLGVPVLLLAAGLMKVATILLLRRRRRRRCHQVLVEPGPCVEKQR